MRDRVNEKVAKRYETADIARYYDEACARQLLEVIARLKQLRMLRNFGHGFWRHYLKTKEFTTSTTTRDYALPSDCLEYLYLEMTPPGLSTPFLEATYCPDEENRHIGLSRHFGGKWGDYGYTFHPNTTMAGGESAGSVLRIFYSITGVSPPVAATGKHHYVRDPIATSDSGAGNCDLPDPWNEGVIVRAAGKCLAKDRIAGYQALFQEADDFINSIVQKPQMTDQRVRATPTSKVAAGASRTPYGQ